MPEPTLEQYLAEHDRSLVANDVDDCLSKLNHEIAGPFYYYRGVSNVAYRLETSLDRLLLKSSHAIVSGAGERRYREQALISEFKKVAHNHLTTAALPGSIFEWLSLMQHHGVPTRLLDLTQSQFIALYFAVRNWTEATDCCIWAISPVRLHESSVHRLRANGFPFKIPNNPYSGLSKFVEDAYFKETFLSGRHEVALILNPFWASQRLANQQGAFLISGSSEITLQDVLTSLVHDRSYKDPREREFEERHRIDMSIMRLTIPADMKKDLFLKLREMNIHAGTLFPGLDGAATGIKELVASVEWRYSSDDLFFEEGLENA